MRWLPTANSVLGSSWTGVYCLFDHIGAWFLGTRLSWCSRRGPTTIRHACSDAERGNRNRQNCNVHIVNEIVLGVRFFFLEVFNIKEKAAGR